MPYVHNSEPRPWELSVGVAFCPLNPGGSRRERRAGPVSLGLGLCQVLLWLWLQLTLLLYLLIMGYFVMYV